MPSADLLQDLAVVMAAGAAVTLLFHRLRLPVVLGYLAAGVLVGPHTPPFAFVRDIPSIETLSELGVVFLLFSVGLEFSLGKLRRVGTTAAAATMIETLLMVGIGYLLGRAFGWPPTASLALGATFAISSTTLVAKLLIDRRLTGEPFAEIVFGILVLEDIVAVLLIALLSGLGQDGGVDAGAMAKGLVRTGVYCAAVIAAGALAAPALLRRAEGTGAEETLLIAAVGLCLGAAGLGSALGVSPVLGAFLAGAIVAGTPQAGAVARRFAPLRDLFTAVFFVTVGMRISPATIAAHPGFVAMVGAVALGGKIVSASLAAFLTGYAPGTALRTGLAMAQVGEFSFILAALALELPEARGAGFLLFAAAGAVSAAGAGLAPVLLGAAPAIERGIERRIPRPVAVFAAVYQGWVRALKDRAGRPAEAPFPRAEALRFLLFGAAFTGGLAAAAAGAGAAEAWIRGRFDLPADPLALYWAATALAALPFLVGAAHAADGLVWRVAETYFPDALRRALRSEAHREAARRTVRFLVWTAASLVFLFVGAPFLPLPVLAVVVLTLFGAGSVALGGAIRRLNDRLQTRLFAFFDGEPSQAPSRHDLLALLREHYPGDVDVLDVLLPARPTAANLSIRDLALRSRTGATVVGIARETGFVPNPPPETALLPGDILFLLGETEELRAAAALLQELSRLPPPGAAAGGVRVEALAVEAGSALIGRTLHEAALPARTGASILVIRRGEETIAHPPPEFRLQAGNVVLVFGTPAQVDAARAAFRGPEPPTETN